MAPPPILTAALLLSTINAPGNLPAGVKPCDISSQSKADIGRALQKSFHIPASARLEIFSVNGKCHESSGDKLRDIFLPSNNYENNQDNSLVLSHLQHNVSKSHTKSARGGVLLVEIGSNRTTTTTSTTTTTTEPSTTTPRTTTPPPPPAPDRLNELIDLIFYNHIDFNEKFVREAANRFLNISGYEKYLTNMINWIFKKQQKWEPLDWFVSEIKTWAAYRALVEVMWPRLNENPQYFVDLNETTVSFEGCCLKGFTSMEKSEFYRLKSELEKEFSKLKNILTEIVKDPRIQPNSSSEDIMIRPYRGFFEQFIDDLYYRIVSVASLLNPFINQFSKTYFCADLQRFYQEVIKANTDNCVKMQLYLYVVEKLFTLRRYWPVEIKPICGTLINQVKDGFHAIKSNYAFDSRAQCYQYKANDLSIRENGKTRDYIDAALFQPVQLRDNRLLLNTGYCQLVNSTLWSILKQKKLVDGVPTMIILAQAYNRSKRMLDEYNDKKYCDDIVSGAPNWAKTFIQRDEGLRCLLRNKLSGQSLYRLKEKENDNFFKVTNSRIPQDGSPETLWTIAIDSTGRASIADIEFNTLVFSPEYNQVLAKIPGKGRHLHTKWFIEPVVKLNSTFTISTRVGSETRWEYLKGDCSSEDCGDSIELQQWELECDIEKK